jgi:hypothetical protein
VTVVCFIWTTGDGSTPPLSVTPSPDSASSNAGGGFKSSSGVVLGPRLLVTLFFFAGIAYFILVVRTFWVWSSVGAIPLRVGEGDHTGHHHSKEDNAAGGTGKGLGVVPEMKEGGSSLPPRSPDQHADTDETSRGRSLEKKDASHVEVVVSKGETGWEKGPERWWGRFSSKDNLAEGAGTMADALDLPIEFESRRIVEESSEGEAPLRSAEATPSPGSVLGVSLHG